jgi:branched-chain amino acid transport system substrate-binding protein
MYEPFHKLKYSFAATYYDQMRLGVPILVKEKNAKQICAMHQDDEFGLEVFRGAEEGLKSMGMQFAEVTTYKRGATDFASQMQKLASSKCDFVVMGTIIRETIGGIATARRLGFNPTFLGSSASYTDLIHKLGGPAMNGFYSTMSTQHPYLDEAAQPIRFWANKYKTKYNEDPTVFSVYGYNAIDSFLRAVEKSGANVTTESIIKAMDTMVIPPDIFGTGEMTFTATKRLGSNASRMSQITDGRWKVTTGYFSDKK